MEDLKNICSTLDIACLTFVVPLFICVSVRRRGRNKKADHFFSLLCFIDIVMALGDLPYWLCSGITTQFSKCMLNIGTFFLYAYGQMLSLIYTNYMVCYLGFEEKRSARIRRITWAVGIIFAAVTILNLKFGFYYKIDQQTNTYSRGPLWGLSQCFAGIAVFHDIYLLIRYGKKLVLSAWMGSFLYITVPILGSLLQWLTNGIPFVNWFTAIALYLLYFNVNIEMQYQFEKQRKELVESKTTIMLSQIQPHFLYNSLTTIAALCEKSPAEAKRATLDFSRYLRCNIDSVNKRIPVPFKSELEHVQTYLNLEKLRFEKRLNVIMDIQATEFQIPALTIQPLVENAVKHGICNREDGKGTLILSTSEEEKNFKIIIRDDGMGFDTTKKPDDGREHIGIENVKYRLNSMIGATMHVESSVGHGTTVTVLVPKNPVVKGKKSKNNEIF